MPSAPGGSGTNGSGAPSFPGAGSGGATAGRGAFGDAGLTADQRKILQYAVKQSPDARIKLAVEGGAMSASTFILGTDETVIGMGGFTNSDNAPSVAQLEKWTKSGELRYILGSDTNGGGVPPGPADTRSSVPTGSSPTAPRFRPRHTAAPPKRLHRTTPAVRWGSEEAPCSTTVPPSSRRLSDGRDTAERGPADA